LVADGRTAGFVFDASVRKLAHDICVRSAYEEQGQGKRSMTAGIAYPNEKQDI
jgi:hypothetical protein